MTPQASLAHLPSHNACKSHLPSSDFSLVLILLCFFLFLPWASFLSLRSREKGPLRGTGRIPGPGLGREVEAPEEGREPKGAENFKHQSHEALKPCFVMGGLALFLLIDCFMERLSPLGLKLNSELYPSLFSHMAAGLDRTFMLVIHWPLESVNFCKALSHFSSQIFVSALFFFSVSLGC